eukprot:Lithocolla_globosa_v1_NODE_442_length_4041_cov_30.407677.p6 type:complete len:110 gc:universal NODE_442_length_4041_cov_30.407677:1747-2076(+)
MADWSAHVVEVGNYCEAVGSKRHHLVLQLFLKGQDCVENRYHLLHVDVTGCPLWFPKARCVESSNCCTPARHRGVCLHLKLGNPVQIGELAVPRCEGLHPPGQIADCLW